MQLLHFRRIFRNVKIFDRKQRSETEISTLESKFKFTSDRTTLATSIYTRKLDSQPLSGLVASFGGLGKNPFAHLRLRVKICLDLWFSTLEFDEWWFDVIHKYRLIVMVFDKSGIFEFRYKCDIWLNGSRPFWITHFPPIFWLR